MDNWSWLTAIAFTLQWGITILLGLRIVSRRRPPGVALAWLLLVAAVPLIGAGLYLLVGELWLSSVRIKKTRLVRKPAEQAMVSLRLDHPVDWTAVGDAEHLLNALAVGSQNIPAVAGNQVELLSDARTTFDSLIQDIDAAKISCHMLFYIWHPGGMVDELCQALQNAASRGIPCRLLADGVGSSDFIKSKAAKNLRDSGVELIVALPVRWLRARLRRIDLRNHRKIAVIDGKIGYTGSLNMADPSLFKIKAKVGRWIDVTARVTGPAAQALDTVFLADWAIEKDATPEQLIAISSQGEVVSTGNVPIQVIPSGPEQAPRTIHRMLLSSIYAARDELVITTPYFVPDEAMMTALISAAKRGVDTTLVVPARVDSIMVRWASRSYYQDLLEAGVDIRMFDAGMLHAKTVTIDRRIALLGTVNMDRRSFWINFELSMLAYDKSVATNLRDIQGRYIAQATSIDFDQWKNRSLPARVTENIAQLFSPLL